MKEIKNLIKAARRIKQAIKTQENIVLYGDADLDGVTSMIILEEAIKSLGGNIVKKYIPDRGTEGYGLNEKALKRLFSYAPALIILMDLGISNFQEVETAKKKGFQVIIIDHHQVIGKVPEADIVVDPQQRGDSYPFKGLANCGIVFKLAEKLFGKSLSEEVRDNLLELVAIGTLADRMPVEKDNEKYVRAGLSHLKLSFRPGIKVLSEKYGGGEISPDEFAQVIIKILQISDIKDHLAESYILLTEPDEAKARKIIDSLSEEAARRQKEIADITRELEEKILGTEEAIIFEGRDGIPLTFAGAIASRISSRFEKPTFIFVKHRNSTIIRGSARNPKDVDGVKAMSHCSKYLLVYGGHAQASGFTVEEKNLEKLRTCLEDYFRVKANQHESKRKTQKANYE